ncbi:activator-dependent family glycosyltransferase [Streptomyces sp. NPDC058372]|uniref:activator-dependent family glycosyltransferase n=1 Tax=Streptomyces sp. NPDC058372 TaxID=3346464 RepID=UPI0036663A3D
MRVLFVTSPWNSHLYQMVPLAWALQLAGHEVRVAGEPGFVDSITEAGLTAVPIGPDETLEERVRRLMGDSAPTTAASIPPLLTDALYEMGKGPREALPWGEISWLLDSILVPGMWLVNDEMVDDLVSYCRSWTPDLVLCDVIAHAGVVAADSVGAAHARMVCWYDLLLRVRKDFLHLLEQQPPGERRDGLRDWLEGYVKKYGRDFTEEVVTGQFAVNVLPERWRLEPHERTLSMRYVPYNGRSVVPSWLHEAPSVPRVLMTFGISKSAWTGLPDVSIEKLQDTLDSVADLDIELILTLQAEERKQLRRVPENTRIVDFVPMNVILPSCSVVIHHGGAGGFNGAMVYGIPQLIIEGSIDGIAKRAVLTQTGAGLSLALDEMTGPRVREHLTRLLEENAFREGAERLQKEAQAQPTPTELVAELERITAEFRSHRTGD